MESLDVLDPNELLKVFECGIVSLLTSHVVSLRETMAGIIAHSDTILIVHQSNDLAEVFEFPANDVVAPSLHIELRSQSESSEPDPTMFSSRMMIDWVTL